MRRPGPARALLVVALAVAGSGTLTTASAHPGATSMPSRPRGALGNAHTPARSVPDTTSPALSLDGLTVAFSSDASNLVDGDTNKVADVFVRSTIKSPIVRVSTTRTGEQANGASYSPALSVDGKKIVFVSEATNLVPGDTNGHADVFFKNLVSGYVYRVSQLRDGTQANAPSSDPFISLFGDWVTFETAASNLTTNDANGLPDAFVHTRKGRGLRRVVAPDAAEAGIVDGIARTGSATLSHDGRTLAYERLVVREGMEIPLAADVFVETPKPKDPCAIYDHKKKKCTKLGQWGLQRIPMAPWGGRARKMLEQPVVTADGRYVVYEAWSAITPADTAWSQLSLCADVREVGFAVPTCADRTALAENPYDPRMIYLFDHWLGVLIPASTNGSGLPASCSNTTPLVPSTPSPCGGCHDPSPNAYGTVIAFTCDAVNMAPGDTNDARDVFVKDFPGGVVSRVSVSNTHGEGLGHSTRPSISYEGRRVAFASTASTFAGSDTNDRDDVFLRDRHTDTPNRPPSLEQPFERAQGLDVGTEFRFRLEASDPDPGEVLRYGAITPMPEGASIDPIDGIFTWTPSPEQTEAGGKRWDVVVWVGDPRGGQDIKLLTMVVRDPGGTVRCQVLGSACQPVV